MHSAFKIRSAVCGAIVFGVVLLGFGDSSSALAFVLAPAGTSSPRASNHAKGAMSTSTEPDTAKHQQLPLPSTVKGILFDMDGTLTDSDTLHFEAYRETFLKVIFCCTEC